MLLPQACCGPSQSGKTSLLASMIKRHDEVFDTPPTKIYLVCAHADQDLYTKIIQDAPCPVDVIDEEIFKIIKPEHGAWLICDDVMDVLSREIQVWFTRRSHHGHVSLFVIVQNLFSKASTYALSKM